MRKPLFPSLPKNGGVFLGSLFFAFLLWFLFYLSRDFSINTALPVRLIYKSDPHNSGSTGLHNIQVKILGRAWLISQFASTKDKEPLILNSNTKFQSSLKIKKFFTEISSQLPKGIVLQEILTDSIILNKVKEITKKVPLHFGFQISFQKQFYFSKPARIYPDSVSITGSKEVLKNIRTWVLPNIQLNAVSHTIDSTVSLEQSIFPEIRVSPAFAKIEIQVERFTESIISLPIKIIHNDEGRVITLIPSRVKITYLVPLSYYSTVREDLFQTEVDLEEWKKNPQIGKLKINLIRSPDFIRIIKKSPPQADFIIYQ